MLNLCQHHKVGCNLVSFMVLLSIQHKLCTNSHSFLSATMVDFAEIPLELQLREANHRIQNHLAKGQNWFV